MGPSSAQNLMFSFLISFIAVHVIRSIPLKGRSLTSILDQGSKYLEKTGLFKLFP